MSYKTHSSTETNHASYLPFFELDLSTSKSVKKLSIPQKKIYLQNYLSVIEDEVLEMLSSKIELEDDTASQKLKKVKKRIKKESPPAVESIAKKFEFKTIKNAISALDDKKLNELVAKSKPEKLIAHQMKVNQSHAAPSDGGVMNQPALANSILGYVMYEKLAYLDKGLVKSDDVVSQFVLPPGGEIEIVKKSWSKMSMEFEETESQLMEEEAENSQSQNKEIAESSSKQQQYNLNHSSSAQGTGNFGMYKVTMNAAHSIGAAFTNTRKESTKEKQEFTKKAAARSRKEHKLTIKRSTEFGSEETITERFKNLNKFHPVNYKLFKGMKEWEIRHEVHGVALCADVMVKNPGINLRRLLKSDFDPNSVPEINEYYVHEDIDPVPPDLITETQVLKFPSDRAQNRPFAFAIPSGYIIRNVFASGNNGRVSFDGNIDDIISGDQMGLYRGEGHIRGHRVYNYRRSSSNPNHSTEVTLTAHFQLETHYYQAWREYAEDKMKEIFKEKWELEQELEEAKSRAMDESRNIPLPQILRDHEKQELASGVAKFLMTGDSAPTPISDQDGVTNPSQVYGSSAGRLISILHHAFEWHNASYFLYPYWWDMSVFNDTDVEDVLKIDHKDHIRKKFLQASWARVLVPISPDNERLIIEIMYGPSAIVAIDRKWNDPTYEPPEEFAEIVNAYVSLHDERDTGGRFHIDENLSTANDQLSDSDVAIPAPVILSKWTEYTPTDETFAEMELLKDKDGNLVNLGEGIALRSEAIKASRETIVNSILEDVVGNVGETKISINLPEQVDFEFSSDSDD